MIEDHNHEYRTGIGTDIHRIAADRKLMLGGVYVPFPAGLAGHSDGDVALHAVIDALLGAAGLGDIGRHFPPGEPEYRGISSLTLLQTVSNKLKENGWDIGNIDATVIAEQPKLGDFIEPIRSQLGRTLDIAPGQVSVKASTSNGLGFIGRGEGIAAMAIALLNKR